MRYAVLIFCLGLWPFFLFAQNEAFDAKIQEIYGLAAELEEAKKEANAFFKTLEKEEPTIAIYSYYLMLSQIGETLIKDEKLAEKAKEKAEKIMTDYTKSVSEGNWGTAAQNEWYQDIYPKLFENTEPNIAQRAAKYLEAHPDLQNYNHFTYVAYAFDKAGDYTKAKRFFEQAMTLRINPETEMYSMSYYINFLAKSGEYQQVQNMIEELVRLNRVTTSYVKTAYRTELMNAHSTYYRYTGDFANFIKASRIQYAYYDSLMTSNDMVCQTNGMSLLTVLGYAYESLKQFDLAEKTWKERDLAYDQWITCNNENFPDHPQLPMSLYPIYLSKTGRLNELKVPVEKYLEEYENYFDSFEKYATSNTNSFKGLQLGFLYDKQYLTFYDQLLEQIVDTKDFTEATKPFAQYAWFCTRDGEFDRANKTYAQLFGLNHEWLNDLISTFGEKAFVAYFNLHIKEGYDNYHSYVKILKDRNAANYEKHIAQDYNNVLLTKSIGFRGTLKKKQLFLNSNDSEVRELYELWIDKKRNLINHYQQQAKEKQEGVDLKEVPIDLAEAQKEVHDIENQLAERSKNFDKLLKMEQPNWKKIRNKLREGEAAIEMIRFNWRNKVYYSDSAYYAAYIIKKNSEYPEVVYLPNSAQALEQKYYRGYQNNIKLKTKDAHSYDAYWKAIKDELEGVNKVYFSPDGIYHLINLPTMPNPKTDDYLLDEIEVHYVTSTSSLIKEQGDVPIANSVLFGRPTYDIRSGVSIEMKDTLTTRSFVSSFKTQGVSDLPGTEEEILTINRVMTADGVKVKYYLGEKATEEELYALNDPDILHIATHGYWTQSEDEVTAGYRMFNAMMNSGLLLAGVVNYYSQTDHPYAHDGILTAYEAQSLNLDKTELVVLSACETGLGHFDAGEGVYGLQRAFRSAGASSVMTSLWKVDDQATKDFMIAFYQKYIQTQDKFAAFRSAQLTIKEKYKDPYYWGAFVLSGI